MEIFYSDTLVVPIPEGHRFPMPKYALLRQGVFQSGLFDRKTLKVSPAATDDQILQVHSRDYFDKVVHGSLSEREIRRIGLPWSPELVVRTRHSVGGTISACRAALRDGLGVNLAGGTHHAHRDFGSGFCVFNDVAIAVRTLQAEGRLQQAVILDCDVHQGDGTAAIFHDDPSVFTFSIHGQKNFPYRKEPSDLDIGLPDGCDDQTYLDALGESARSALVSSQPGLAVYIAGADPYEGDRLGRLALSKDGLAQRDRLVLSLCAQQRVPVAIVMGGGYGKRIQDSVDIHLATLRIAATEIQ